mmetsp:Transcript_54186/g.117067  ORF Transcript_54186/g.117067 Transcript_54186/m.117067 type:complete len:238 (-) Transcript_54186:1579-2292(-)
MPSRRMLNATAARSELAPRVPQRGPRRPRHAGHPFEMPCSASRRGMWPPRTRLASLKRPWGCWARLWQSGEALFRLGSHPVAHSWAFCSRTWQRAVKLGRLPFVPPWRPCRPRSALPGRRRARGSTSLDALLAPAQEAARRLRQGLNSSWRFLRFSWHPLQPWTVPGRPSPATWKRCARFASRSSRQWTCLGSSRRHSVQTWRSSKRCWQIQHRSCRLPVQALSKWNTSRPREGRPR